MIVERKLLIISGPIISIGRSGASWGKESKEWDVITHSCINDIVRNNDEASQKGYSVLGIFWEKDVEKLDPSVLQKINYITISDPYIDNETITLGTPNVDEYALKKIGSQGKNLLSNDQRQLLSLQAGINYGKVNGFSHLLRIRTDQVFCWEIMEEDFKCAITQDKILLPAQRDFNKLDLDYTGFSFLDFFIGGKIQELDFMVRLALSQGRLVGPHFDLIWKYLPFNDLWSRIHPGFSTLRGTSNRVLQEIYSRDFWNLIAMPSSESNMSKLIWRGIQLNEIPYFVSLENLSLNESRRNVSPKELDFTTKPNLYYEYNWALISKYLTGPEERNPKLILDAYCETFLDHVRDIVRRKQIESLKIPVWQLAFKALCFAVITYMRASRFWHFASKVKNILIARLQRLLA